MHAILVEPDNIKVTGLPHGNNLVFHITGTNDCLTYKNCFYLATDNGLRVYSVNDKGNIKRLKTFKYKATKIIIVNKKMLVGTDKDVKEYSVRDPINPVYTAYYTTNSGVKDMLYINGMIKVYLNNGKSINIWR